MSRQTSLQFARDTCVRPQWGQVRKRERKQGTNKKEETRAAREKRNGGQTAKEKKRPCQIRSKEVDPSPLYMVCLDIYPGLKPLLADGPDRGSDGTSI